MLLAQPRSEVSHLAKLVLSVSGLPSVPPRLLASELLQWLMSLGFCFVTGSISRCGFVTSGFATTLEDVPLVHFSQLFQRARPTIHVYHHRKQSHTGESSSALQWCVSTQQVKNRYGERRLATTLAQTEEALLPARALHTTLSTSLMSGH